MYDKMLNLIDKSNELLEKLITINDKELNLQKNILNDTFESWRGNLEQVDDVTLIGFKVS